MKHTNRIIRYSGSKHKYVDSILEYVNASNKDIYCEPFCGSASVFLNTKDNFKKYYISDIDRNIIRIFKSFKEINYTEYQYFINLIKNKFGNVKDYKESYYAFRDWFNANCWNTDTIEEGIYLMFLANSCINSMLRFGPNGMNQSYGNRSYQNSYSSEEHNKIREKLNKCEILNINFFDNIKMFNDLNAFYFIDPPYIKRGTSYSTITDDNRIELFNFIKDKEYVYTDIYEESIEKELNCDIKVLRDNMRNTSPLRKKDSLKNKEVIYTNIKIINEYELF